VSAAGDSISVALAEWNRHQHACPQCTNAPNSAGLCLAGAALWQRAGLAVVPVQLPPDPKHPRHLRTSELLRFVADDVQRDAAWANDGETTAIVDELRRRAAYLETLGDHDLPNGGRL
jgi:hypothetical protein